MPQANFIQHGGVRPTNRTHRPSTVTGRITDSAIGRTPRARTVGRAHTDGPRTASRAMTARAPRAQTDRPRTARRAMTARARLARRARTDGPRTARRAMTARARLARRARTDGPRTAMRARTDGPRTARRTGVGSSSSSGARRRDIARRIRVPTTPSSQTLDIVALNKLGWQQQDDIPYSNAPGHLQYKRIDFIHDIELEHDEVWSMTFYAPNRPPFDLTIGVVSSNVTLANLHQKIQESKANGILKKPADYQAFDFLSGVPYSWNVEVPHEAARRAIGEPRKKIKRSIIIQLKIDNKDIPMVRYHNLDKDDEWGSWVQIIPATHKDFYGNIINSGAGARDMKTNTWHPYLSMKKADFMGSSVAAIGDYHAKFAGMPYITKHMVSRSAASRL